MIDHTFYMKEALKEAEEAGKRGDRPIGAVIVHDGKIISRGSNRISTLENEVAHAEINAIHSCTAYLKKHAENCTIYTTVEPCMMCLTTIVMANIRHIVFGVKDNYLQMENFIESVPYVKKRLYTYESGILSSESEQIIKKYSPFMAEIIFNGRKPS